MRHSSLLFVMLLSVSFGFKKAASFADETPPANLLINHCIEPIVVNNLSGYKDFLTNDLKMRKINIPLMNIKEECKKALFPFQSKNFLGIDNCQLRFSAQQGDISCINSFNKGFLDKIFSVDNISKALLFFCNKKENSGYVVQLDEKFPLALCQLGIQSVIDYSKSGFAQQELTSFSDCKFLVTQNNLYTMTCKNIPPLINQLRQQVIIADNLKLPFSSGLATFCAGSLIRNNLQNWLSDLPQRVLYLNKEIEPACKDVLIPFNSINFLGIPCSLTGYNDLIKITCDKDGLPSIIKQLFAPKDIVLGMITLKQIKKSGNRYTISFDNSSLEGPIQQLITFAKNVSPSHEWYELNEFSHCTQSSVRNDSNAFSIDCIGDLPLIQAVYKNSKN